MLALKGADRRNYREGFQYRGQPLYGRYFRSNSSPLCQPKKKPDTELQLGNTATYQVDWRQPAWKQGEYGVTNNGDPAADPRDVLRSWAPCP